MNTAAVALVSVLTPVRNGAQYLAKCVESVLAQTYTHWEYTIIHNCSTGDSLTTAQKYAATDSWIRVLSSGS
jgi:glycosyltransferase involved in cell wall biosynthesis